MVQHASIDEAFHEETSILRQAEGRQPFVADPFVVHLSEGQTLSINVFSINQCLLNQSMSSQSINVFSINQCLLNQSMSSQSISVFSINLMSSQSINVFSINQCLLNQLMSSQSINVFSINQLIVFSINQRLSINRCLLLNRSHKIYHKRWVKL